MRGMVLQSFRRVNRSETTTFFETAIPAAIISCPEPHERTASRALGRFRHLIGSPLRHARRATASIVALFNHRIIRIVFSHKCIPSHW
jgi:hypothetical protein